MSHLFPLIKAFVLTDLIIIEIRIFCFAISNIQPYQCVCSQLQPTLHFTHASFLTFPLENTLSLFTHIYFPPILQKHSAWLPRLLSCHPHTACFDSTVFLLCGVLFLSLHFGCISLRIHSESQTSDGLLGSKRCWAQAAGCFFLVYMWRYCVLPNAAWVCSFLDNAERAGLLVRQRPL